VNKLYQICPTCGKSRAISVGKDECDECDEITQRLEGKHTHTNPMDSELTPGSHGMVQGTCRRSPYGQSDDPFIEQ
jgi:hypothetical protein